MKLFAIVRKTDGYMVCVGLSHGIAWQSLKLLFGDVSLDSYQCIELHTYDPSKQVVVDRDVYDVIANELRDNYREPHFKAADVNKFLKAGEMK